ncbi:hypothetical protein ACPUER_06870 [Burkholderia sp. DN3021]|uniref:hypothetical protein n=1 Tax=Burkholderia sp. DN3021 TaxID=3410137 RepID=UPI003C79ABB5
MPAWSAGRRVGGTHIGGFHGSGDETSPSILESPRRYLDLVELRAAGRQIEQDSLVTDRPPILHWIWIGMFMPQSKGHRIGSNGSIRVHNSSSMTV